MMTRTLLALILAVPAAFAAEPVPPLASLAKFSGTVRVVRAGTDVAGPAATAMPLFPGDRVLTTSGRAEVLFLTGGVIRLSADATLEIHPPADSRRKGLARVFARLLKGSLLAVVRKVEPGEGFAVRSGTAIASVKGTMFEAEDGIVTVLDEGDPEPHTVGIYDEDWKERLVVAEGFRGGLGEDGSLHREEPVDLDEIRRIRQDHDVDAPPPAATGGGEGGGTGEEELRQELHEELAEFGETGDLAEFNDAAERTTDIALGRVLTDRHGNRVEREDWIFQADAYTIEYLTFNFRGGGPSAGTTILQSDLTFNQPLPANFEDVRRGLAAAFADPLRYPSYWVASQYRRATAPAGQFVETAAFLEDPVAVWSAYFQPTPLASAYNTLTRRWELLPSAGASQIGWGQAYEYWLSVGDAFASRPKERFHISQLGQINEGWYEGATPERFYPAGSVDRFGTPNQGQLTVWSSGPDPFTGMYPVDPNFNPGGTAEFYAVHGTPRFDNPWFGAGTRAVTKIGSFVTEVRTVYGDGSFLAMNRYVVADDGTVQGSDPAAVGGTAASEEYFHGLRDTLNYEVEFRASEFGEGLIDILIDPQIFDDGKPADYDTNRMTIPAGGPSA